jgi:hypothetical protein
MVKDYQRGKIYKIVCNITNKIYIGSTCEPTLARRLAKHVSNFKDWKKDSKNSYISSFQIIEGGDYYIELLEICSCTIKEELLARERFYIKNNDCVNKLKNLNMTEEDKKENSKEYYKNNKDKINIIHKEYYDNNKCKILEQCKEYRETHKEQKKETDKKYYDKNTDKILEYQKIYREENKDKIEQYKKEYYKKNKDAINARRREIAKIKRENALVVSNPI